MNGPEDGLTEVIACIAGSIGISNLSDDPAPVKLNMTFETWLEENCSSSVERERVDVIRSTERTLCDVIAHGAWHTTTNAAASAADECSITTGTRLIPGNTDAGCDCSRTLLNMDMDPETAKSGRVTGTTLNNTVPVVALVAGNTKEMTVDVGRTETTRAAIDLPEMTTLRGPGTDGKLLIVTETVGESRADTALGITDEIEVLAGE